MSNYHTTCNDSTKCVVETNKSERIVEDEFVTEKKDVNFAKKAAIGAGVGVMLGAGTAAAADYIIHENDFTHNGNDDVVLESDVNVANCVNDDMSFSEAFEAARAEVGPGGVFHWHGNTYNTYTENEWNTMSDAERAEFGDRVQSEIQNDVNMQQSQQQSTVTHTNTVEHHQSSEHHQPVERLQEDEDIVVKPENPDVELIGIQDEVLEDGSVVTIGAATVNGHNVVVVDVDHDSEFDVAYIDSDDNGYIDTNEITDISAEHLTVSEFAQIGSDNNTYPTQTDLADNDMQIGNEGDMPDYVNDADILA